MNVKPSPSLPTYEPISDSTFFFLFTMPSPPFGETASSPHSTPGSPCVLCLAHPETTVHLFRECAVACKAIPLIISRSSDNSRDFLARFSIDDLLLRSPTPAPDCIIALQFSLAVWSARNRKLSQPSLNPHSIAELITSHFLSLSQPPTRVPHTVDRRAAARREFLTLYANLPTPSLRVFTDGSSFNLERAGAGFVVVDADKGVIGMRSDFLGPASNNVAKLSAIANAVRYCTDLFSKPDTVPIPVYLFVDSSYAINVTEGKWKAKSNLKTVQHTISALSTLRSLTSVHFRWVPGHSNIFEQELSDFLAKRGAEGVSSSTHPHSTALSEIRRICNLQYG
jgi:ribonuclease HI